MERGTFNESIQSSRKTWSLPVGNKMTVNAANKEEIAKVVCNFYDLSVQELKMKVKKREIVIPRQIAMWFYSRYTRLTLNQIGEIFDKDHATVVNACKIVNRDIEINYDNRRIDMVAMYNVIKNLIQESKPMCVAYICHPVVGDIEANIKEILDIVKEINLNEPHVVPFAPYLPDVLAMNDCDPEHRARGIKNDRHLIALNFIDECRVYGDRISEGMWNEITMFNAMKVPVKVLDKRLLNTSDFSRLIIEEVKAES